MKRAIPLLLLALSLSLPGEDVIHARTTPQQQEIVIEAKNDPLASVLEKLEKTSGYKVQYVSSDVYGLKVDKTIHAAKVNDALDQILQGTGLTYVIDKQYVTIKKGNAVPQEKLKANVANSKLVSGVVVDNKGIPLHGATVRIKNTGLGTTTDAEGHFHTEQSKLTVEVSYLGFNSVVRTLDAGRNIKIVLKEDHQSIDEVVVTGIFTYVSVN